MHSLTGHGPTRDQLALTSPTHFPTDSASGQVTVRRTGPRRLTGAIPLSRRHSGTDSPCFSMR
jgi:hypothetical protein